jgi:putative SOS response-associated peptidase YedK
MIDRYSITASADKIAERFSVDVPDTYKAKYNAGPTHLLPVITSNMNKGVSIFYWGTSPEWLKNKAAAEKIINARTEWIHEKPALKRAMMRSRCLIPADGFYGWKRTGKKTQIPYRFVVTNQDVFSYAGLWEEYEDTNGLEFHTFTIITVPANDLVKAVCDRMPVVLDRETEQVWMNQNSQEEDLLKILQPYASIKMNLYSVSPRIFDTEADVPSLIMPAPPADQFGNLTLFD